MGRSLYQLVSHGRCRTLGRRPVTDRLPNNQAQRYSENNLVSFPVLSQIKPQAPTRLAVVRPRLDHTSGQAAAAPNSRPCNL
jgi:hypothetical protein